MRWTILAVLSAAGCGTKDGDVAGTADTGGDADTDADSDTDADVDTTGSTTGTTGTTTLPTADSIGLIEAVGPTMPGGQSYVYAAFFDESGFTGGTMSTGSLAVGECVFYPPFTGGTTGATAPTLDPGDLAVSVGGNDVPVSDAGGYWFGTMSNWPEGQDLAASATGADFPAFDVDPLLTLPGTLALSGQPSNIDSTANLDLAWSGSSSGQVGFQLAGSTGGEVSCYFADDGSGTVDASLLAMLSGPVQATAWSETSAVVSPDSSSAILAFGIGPAVSWNATVH